MRLKLRRLVALLLSFNTLAAAAYGKTPDNAFQENCENLPLREGYNSCFGSKCRKVWVYTMDEDRLYNQPKNRHITNLRQFELEFWARIELSKFIAVEASYETTLSDGKERVNVTETLKHDPFLSRFEKKIYCKLPKTGPMQEYMFIGILPSSN